MSSSSNEDLSPSTYKAIDNMESKRIGFERKSNRVPEHWKRYPNEVGEAIRQVLLSTSLSMDQKEHMFYALRDAIISKDSLASIALSNQVSTKTLMNCLSMTRINLNKTLGVMQSIVSPNIASPTSNCLPGWFAIRQIAAQNPNEASTQIQNDTQTETQSSSKSENVSTTSVPTTKTSSSEETGSERDENDHCGHMQSTKRRRSYYSESDERMRKRLEQNRLAATRVRMRRLQEREMLINKVSELEQKNKSLMYELEQMVDLLKVMDSRCICGANIVNVRTLPAENTS
ncbi:bZIP transcription factor domain-containing protein [Ditylenchus destructor]|uniref:BZIP transcription factor domain-containing protein n=1 Tax=Ditylenchus destructor TaxID=166010 RepID=A0AAD4N7H4_9BILA|nr:bZIP transcription factor domain-containing protein [Ditylenchus destructor]